MDDPRLLSWLGEPRLQQSRDTSRKRNQLTHNHERPTSLIRTTQAGSTLTEVIPSQTWRRPKSPRRLKGHPAKAEAEAVDRDLPTTMDLLGLVINPKNSPQDLMNILSQPSPRPPRTTTEKKSKKQDNLEQKHRTKNWNDSDSKTMKILKIERSHQDINRKKPNPLGMTIPSPERMTLIPK